MVKEADLNRISVPQDYEVLDATALGRRLGFKRDTVLTIRGRGGSHTGKPPPFSVPAAADQGTFVAQLLFYPPSPKEGVPSSGNS